MIVLFDLDGVLLNTEIHYTRFWNEEGLKYVNIPDFGHVIKGQTLVQIFERYFVGPLYGMRDKMEAIIDEFERNMPYDFVPGAEALLTGLKEAGVHMAIVTSSNAKKMENVYRAHPELPEIMDQILKSGDFTKSKPDPECFLKGMELLGAAPEETIVFEDSIHGLAAARASGAYVIGLTTSNPREVIEPLCDMVIDDFTEVSCEILQRKVQRA